MVVSETADVWLSILSFWNWFSFNKRLPNLNLLLPNELLSCETWLLSPNILSYYATLILLLASNASFLIFFFSSSKYFSRTFNFFFSTFFYLICQTLCILGCFLPLKIAKYDVFVFPCEVQLCVWTEGCKWTELHEWTERFDIGLLFLLLDDSDVTRDLADLLDNYENILCSLPYRFEM